MPAKPGKGAVNVNRNYKSFVNKMTGIKSEASVVKVLVIGMSKAKELAPVEYGTLSQSAYHRVMKIGIGVRGIGGFLAGISIYKGKEFNYAAKLHNTTNWSPRRPEFKEGGAWNPDATPFYLERGFTDPDQISLMKRAIKSEMKI